MTTKVQISAFSAHQAIASLQGFYVETLANMEKALADSEKANETLREENATLKKGLALAKESMVKTP